MKISFVFLCLLTRNVEQRFRRYATIGGGGGPSGSHYHRCTHLSSPNTTRRALACARQITRDSQSLEPGFKLWPTGSSSASACIDQSIIALLATTPGFIGDRRVIKTVSTSNLEWPRSYKKQLWRSEFKFFLNFSVLI